MRRLWVRLTGGYLAIVLVTLVAVGVALNLMLQRYLIGQAQQEFVNQVSQLARLWVQQGSRLTPLTPTQLPDPDTVAITVSQQQITQGVIPDPLGDWVRLSKAEVNQILAGETFYRWLDGGKEAHLVMVQPVPDPLGRFVYFVLSSPLRGLAATLADTRRLLFAAGALALPLAAGAAWLMSRSIADPLNQLTRAATAFAKGDYTARATPKGDDEVALAIRAFNLAAEQTALTVTKQEQLDQLRKDFLANVSHEFRAPLASLRGYLELMADGIITPAEQGHYLQLLLKDTERLSRLVEDLLDLARLQAGQQQLHLRRIEPESAIRGAALRLDPLAKQAQIQLELQLPPQLPWVKADPDRLEQCLLNLATNALRFTPAGGVVTLGAEHQEKFVKIWVQDTGPGIAPEDQSQVWERFYKIDKARTPERSPQLGGTGLGLAIVKELVTAMGGQVGLTSEPGQGSIFWFTLPLEGHVHQEGAETGL